MIVYWPQFMYANSRFCEIYGIAASYQKNIFFPVGIYIHKAFVHNAGEYCIQLRRLYV